MDLRQLRYFVVLAGQRHFGRAAEILHIAQPALTRQIRLLEEELGVRLFERHARGATPTDDAALLLERASFVLRYMEQTRLDMESRQLEPSGPVAIGMSPGLAVCVAAPLFAEVQRRYPRVRVQLVEAFADLLQGQLIEGAIDLAMLTGDANVARLVMTPLLRERLSLIGLASDPRVGGREVRVADLAGVPLVLTGASYGGVRYLLESAATVAGVALTSVAEVHSLEVAKRLVLGGLGLTVHFAAPIRPDLETGSLRAVPIEGLALDRYLARSAERPPSRAMLALGEILQEVIAELVRCGHWPHAKLTASDQAR